MKSEIADILTLNKVTNINKPRLNICGKIIGAV